MHEDRQGGRWKSGAGDEIGMRALIHKCVKCGRYTLRSDRCPSCGGEVRSAHPPNISLEHRYLEKILELRRGRGK